MRKLHLLYSPHPGEGCQLSLWVAWPAHKLLQLPKPSEALQAVPGARSTSMGMGGRVRVLLNTIRRGPGNDHT